MSRERVRSLKRAVRASHRPDADAHVRALASESALQLLARSVDFGHGRLAVVRLALAARSGARIPGEHWAYCAKIAHASEDRQLKEIYLAAAQAHAALVPPEGNH